MADEYIRREDAKKKLRDNLNYLYAYGTDRAPELIDELPPADVAPVVHGTWEHHMSFGICDKCGYEYNWTGTDAKNFCPNCGAKMDGGENG